jgi:hypothetical protein
VNALPSIMAQDDEYKEELEGQSGDDQEIDRGRAMDVILQEGPPPVIGIRRASGHVSGDRCLADEEAELQELAVDPWRTPKWVLRGLCRTRALISSGALGRPPRRRDFQPQ